MKICVSIIITNYNGENLLQECLDSLEKQNFERKFECIVVDNGSKDESISILKKHKIEPKIISLDKNYGVSYALNRGIEASNGEFVIFLNNDTKAEINWLENLVTAIEADEKIFSVGSKMLNYHNPELIDDAGEEYCILGWVFQNGKGKKEKKYNKKIQVFANSGGASIYRKKIFDEIGCVDEEFFAYVEDVDISYRAMIYGYKNLYEPKARILHIGSASFGGQYNSFKTNLVARNNIWLIYKNMPLIQIIINSPFLLIGFLIKTLFFSKKKLAKVYIDGLREGIKSINKVKKVKIKNENWINYTKIQLYMIKNMFKFIMELF